jgi:CheY-like chemotaxis protein
MSRKILHIESDGPFAEEISSALEARGLEVRTTGDGREGFELAREWGPDAIILCVELPGMSGYVICQKLKKDEALKSIPLIITSAEATAETFEKHKTLKVRAEDYLLKPFTPRALVASLGAFFDVSEEGAEDALPEDRTGGDEEELVALEEEAGIEALEGQPLGGPDLPALDLGSLPDDGPEPGSLSGLDDDLKMLDEAFEGLSSAPAPRAAPRTAASPARRAPSALDLDLGGDAPIASDELDAAAASLPQEDDAAARAALGRLDLVADDALGALGDSPPELELPSLDSDISRDLGLGLGDVADDEPPAASRPPVRGASPDLLRAAGIRVMGDKPSPAPAGGGDSSRLERELSRRDKKVADLEARLRELADRAADGERRADENERRAEAADKRASEASSRLAAAESQAASAKARLDSALAQTKRLDADLKALRDEANRARDRAEQAEAAVDDERRRADEAAARAGSGSDDQEKIEALEREVDELKTELVVARGEVEGARGEVEKRSVELKRRVQELEAQASKNEERVVKAYLKIKNDEKVREKTRKALTVATQLLDEGAPAAESSAEKPRTSAAAAAAAALGREQ